MMGAIVSIVAVIFLTVRVIKKRSLWHIIAFSIYGLGLVGMYTISALYHCLPVSKTAVNILQRIDQAMIYFLIVGTSTPIFLIVIEGGKRWRLFAINWSLAVAGIILRLLYKHPPRIAIVCFFFFYFAMGSFLMLSWKSLVRSLPKRGVLWMIGGGLFYTIGAVILNIEAIDLGSGIGGQQIWPFFVMLGSFCHFWLMYKYVVHMK
jgi:hemolysin III